MDFQYMKGQDVFDSGLYMHPETFRAHMIVERIALKHADHVVEHGKWPEEYWDDVQEAATKYGFEFTHPKYAAGPKAVESRPTVH